MGVFCQALVRPNTTPLFACIDYSLRRVRGELAGMDGEPNGAPSGQRWTITSQCFGLISIIRARRSDFSQTRPVGPGASKWIEHPVTRLAVVAHGALHRVHHRVQLAFLRKDPGWY